MKIDVFSNGCEDKKCLARRFGGASVSVAFQAPTVKERDLINSHAGAAWKGLVRSKLPKRDGLRPSPSRVAPEFQFEKKRAPPDTKHSAIRPYADEDQPIDMPWKIMSIGTREWAYRS